MEQQNEDFSSMAGLVTAILIGLAELLAAYLIWRTL